MTKLQTKTIIISLTLIALLLALITSYLNRPPKIISFYPNKNQYFSYIHIAFNQPVDLKHIKLAINPNLSFSLSPTTSSTQLTWLLQQSPRKNTTYTFTLTYKKHPLKTWQITTPHYSFDIGSYPPDVLKDLDHYLKNTQLLQLLPPPNPYFLVKYHNEHHITIYPLHPNQNLAHQKAKDWLNSLPPTINRANLQIDWAP